MSNPIAFCGDTTTLSGSVEGVSAHIISISETSNETDVRNFDSEAGGFGDWLACSKAAQITMQSYLPVPLDVSDTSTFEATIANEAVSYPVVVTGKDTNVDAKGLVEFSITMRVTGESA